MHSFCYISVEHSSQIKARRPWLFISKNYIMKKLQNKSDEAHQSHHKNNENLNVEEDHLTGESELNDTPSKNAYAADAYQTEDGPAPSHTPGPDENGKPVSGRIKKKGSAFSSE